MTFKNLAILIPARNDSTTIARVIYEFRQAFPASVIIAGDMCSDDDTYKVAENFGAKAVICRKNLSSCVTQLLNEDSVKDADLFLIAPPTADYYPSDASYLLKPVDDGEADMAVGIIKSSANIPDAVKRPKSFITTKLFNKKHKARAEDVSSLFRAFNLRVREAASGIGHAKDIMAALSEKALEQGLIVKECCVKSRDR